MSPESNGAGDRDNESCAAAGIPREIKEDASNGLESEQPFSSTDAGGIKCSVCQSSFRRPEHLKRHFRSHTKEKPFGCAQCGRYFSRTDTLHRHELSHHTVGPEGGKDHAHRITVKTFRACFKCAAARVRCSGGTPCGRCDTRSLSCVYPTERRSKAKSRKHSSQKSPHINAEESCHSNSRHPRAEDAYGAGLGQKAAEPAFQTTDSRMSQFRVQLNEPNTWDRRSGTSVDTNAREPADNVTAAQRVPHHEGLQSHFPGAQGPSDRVVCSTDMEASYIRKDMPTFDDQGTYLSGQAARFSNDFQPGRGARSRNDTGMPVMNHDRRLPDSTMPSMNWLSVDLHPNAANKSSSLLGAPSQPNLNDMLPQGHPSAAMPWLPPANSLAPEQTPQPWPGSTSQGAGAERLRDCSQVAANHSHSGVIIAPEYKRDQCISRTGQNLDPLLGFSPTQEVTTVPASWKAPRHRLERSMYREIHSYFIQLCCTENLIYQAFQSKDFPSTDILTNFIHFYFHSFQHVYPIFHSATFNPNACHWLVTLAVASVGSQYAEITGANQLASVFHEFLRRALNIERERYQWDRTPLWYLQASLLNCIGLIYNGGDRTRLSALSNFADLVNRVQSESLLQRSHEPTARSNATTQEQRWMAWIEDEMRRRIGYCIWLVDCSVAYHFDRRPLLTLDDGQAALPSHESQWQSSTAETWGQAVNEPLVSNVSLYEAIQIMYIEKRLVTGIGEFGRLLLVHAIYHRTFEVGDYFRRPLSFWNPTAQKQSLDSAIPSGSVWLAGIPSYSKWRNSACDCLDILHWAANSTIAQTSGFELPIVLHLHAARLILLTPFRELKALATSLAHGEILWSEHQRTTEWHHIWRWIKHDQYKARLGVIHAGATLWYIRRYSTSTFHEPFAAFLAVLTLWAYGSCQTQVLHESGPHDEPRSDPPSIHLDRPCNDELVQLFVREGQTMKSHIMGVGNICGPNGSEGVLRAGYETLAGLKSWKISKDFMAILATMAELASQNSNTLIKRHEESSMNIS